MNARTDALSESESKMKRKAGYSMAVTNTVILLLDLAMLFTSVALYSRGQVDFTGVLIPTVALMSSFGPCVALANLGSTLQSTFAAGKRVLDILEEAPLVEEVSGQTQVEFTGAAAENMGANSLSSNSSDPMDGQPKAMVLKVPAMSTSNFPAVNSAASPPWACTPSATAWAMASVLPVPLQ